MKALRRWLPVIDVDTGQQVALLNADWAALLEPVLAANGLRVGR